MEIAILFSFKMRLGGGFPVKVLLRDNDIEKARDRIQEKINGLETHRESVYEGPLVISKHAIEIVFREYPSHKNVGEIIFHTLVAATETIIVTSP